MLANALQTPAVFAFLDLLKSAELGAIEPVRLNH